MISTAYIFAIGIFIAIGGGLDLKASTIPSQLLVSALKSGRTGETFEDDWIEHETSRGASNSIEEPKISGGDDSRCQGYTCRFRSSCGRAPLNPIKSSEPYIVNGEDQIHGEWPSFVRFYINWKKEGKFSCSGVIVSDRHILTAAHCVHRQTDTLASIKVMAGEHNKRAEHPQRRVFNGDTVHVARVYAREKEESAQLNHDWAVLTLEDRIKFTDYIQPACLPYNFTGRPKYRNCYLVGAGLTGLLPNGTKYEKDVIQKMRVRQVSCVKFEKIGIYVGATRACYTKLESEGSPCNGDSGGPILCIDSNTRRWTVIGTTSTSDEFCDGKDFAWASTFARITTLLPTIKAETGL